MDRSPLLALHHARGARLADRPEAPGFAAALTFGDVPAEYRAAREHCGLFDASDRSRVSVGGKDATDFLHRLLANHVKSLAPNTGNQNLLLTPKGKVDFVFELVRQAQGFTLSAAPGRAPGLQAALERFHFAEKLSVEESSATHAPLELVGPRAVEVLSELTGTRPELTPGSLELRDWRGATLELFARRDGSWRVDAGAEHVVALWDALRAAGARPCGLVARDSLRVEAGRALVGVDVDENVYPQEAGLEAAFALDKGCYVGQEVVAKIDTYGGLNKRLLPLRLEHSEPVARGTKLVREEEGEHRELGLVTSWAYSFALDTGLVLAYVKRRHQAPGTTFELQGGGGTATLVTPPLA